MRQIILCLFSVVLGTAAAEAACRGTNLLERMRSEDPNAYAAVYERAEQIPNGVGRFWQIDDGKATPSYLFGTYHTQQARRTVPAAVWPALENARIAIFELSLEEQAAMQTRMATDPEFAFDFQAAPISADLKPEQTEILRNALATRGIALESAEHMRPWLLFTLLAFPACHLEAVSKGAQPLDKLMAERAKERGIEQRGLETYEEALAAFRRIQPERFLQMMIHTSDMVGIEEDIFRTTLDLYSAGEIAAVAEFSILLTDAETPGETGRDLYNDMMAELLDVRNKNWLPSLLDEIRKGGAFIGVGALHLPGDAGLIELLRQQGMSLTLISD